MNRWSTTAESSAKPRERVADSRERRRVFRATRAGKKKNVERV